MTVQLRSAAASVVCAVLLSASAIAQGILRGDDAKLPRFEVASVKVNRSGRAGEAIARTGMRPDGSFTAVNAAASDLVRVAYDYPNERIVGLPKWADDERFDVSAKASPAPSSSGGPITPERIAAMMRSLLAERFKLATHTEMRDGAVYELRVARADGRLGPGLVPTNREDCAAMLAGRAAPASAPIDRGQPVCGMSIAFGRLSAGGVQMDQLASGSLTRLVGRPVLDRTGLRGTFDVELPFPFGETPANLPFVVPGDSTPVDPNTPTIFTSIQEQLGLKLVSARAPVDVLVIDHMEQPEPD